MVEIKDLDYAADGSTLIGRLALPEGNDTRPAVLIAHEGGGLDDYQKGRAARFAELGYVACAVAATCGSHPNASGHSLSRASTWSWPSVERTRRGLPLLATASAARWCSSSPAAART